jgi:crotonobetainyl-CoA:carnitine CoA-transferase CaiB-like acyl-CoA transferase
VVSENFSGGVMARWGFSYEDMAAINPRVIYVSNSGFGGMGPYVKYKTWGPIVQAMGGLTANSGLPNQPPAGWGYSYMDHTGGYFMAMAILAALYYRNRHGVGQWVDMACTDAAAALNGPALLDYTVNGRKLNRPGSPDTNHNDSPVMVPHNIYASQGEDNWVAIAARDNRDWLALCDVIGRAEWKTEVRFATPQLRKRHEAEIDAGVAQWTSQRTHREAMLAMQRAGVPAGMVQRPADRVDNDENTHAWGLWPEVTHAAMGRVKVDGMPIKLSETPGHISRGAPLLGQHNEQVYGELLGLSKDEIAALKQERVI